MAFCGRPKYCCAATNTTFPLVSVSCKGDVQYSRRNQSSKVSLIFKDYAVPTNQMKWAFNLSEILNNLQLLGSGGRFAGPKISKEEESGYVCSDSFSSIYMDGNIMRLLDRYFPRSLTTAVSYPIVWIYTENSIDHNRVTTRFFHHRRQLPDRIGQDQCRRLRELP